jgi:hypothetical protein
MSNMTIYYQYYYRISIKVLFFCFVVLIFFTADVLAQSQTKLDTEILIEIQDNKDIIVSQKIIVNNLSNQSLIESINIDLPFNKLNLNPNIIEISQDQQLKSFEIVGNNIIVDLSNSKIKYGTQSEIQLIYKIEGALKSYGSIYDLYIPNFANNQIQNITLKIISSNDITYISQKCESQDSADKRILECKQSNDIYLVLGNYSLINLKLNWKIKKPQTSLVLPSNNVANVSYNELVEIYRGYSDIVNNEYLFFDNFEGQNPNGYLEVNIIPRLDNIKYQKGNRGYLQNWEILEIDNDDEIKDIYIKIVDEFDPNINLNNWKRDDNKKIIEKDKHLPLDYTNALVSLLRSKDIKSEIVYGLAKSPRSQTYQWHVWVVYNTEDGNWKQIDPYLEDLTGFDYFTDLADIRIPFGIIDDNDSHISFTDNITYTTIQEITFLEENVLGANSYDIETTINMQDYVYSGKYLEGTLIIYNPTNYTIRINNISLGNIELSNSKLYSYLVLPKGSEVIPIPGQFISNPFKQGNKSLQGKITYEINNKYINYELSKEIYFEVNFRMIMINSAIIFSLILLIIIYLRKTIFAKH